MEEMRCRVCSERSTKSPAGICAECLQAMLAAGTEPVPEKKNGVPNGWDSHWDGEDHE